MKILSLLIALLALNSAHAQTATNTFQITGILTGWASDRFDLIPSGGVNTNPAHCPNTDLYVSDISQPGYKTHYAAALLAFAMKKTVSLTIDNMNCNVGRPQIISIWINQ